MKKKFYANWWFISLIFIGVIAVCFLIIVPIINGSMKENDIKQEFWEEASYSEDEPQNTPLKKQINAVKHEETNTIKTNTIKTNTIKTNQHNEIKHKTKNTPKPKTDPTKAKDTVAALDAMNLFIEYDKNKAEADEKYKGKRFATVGTVINVITSSTGKPVMEFQGKDSVSVVSCEFPKNAMADIEAIKKGDIITVKGVCEGINNNAIVFKKCKIVK